VVQIVHDAQLALLLHAARERRHAGQQALELELDLDIAQAPDRSGRPMVEATGSLILWEALGSVYDALGFTAVRDEAFQALVLGGSSSRPARSTPCGC
jgi:hypothetical protein